MTPEKMVAVIKMYEQRLAKEGIPKVRMDPDLTFGELSEFELLRHAHFLCDDAKKYAQDPSRQRKAGSHLTVIQMCLSFAGWYTLEDLMNHNRPSDGPTSVICAPLRRRTTFDYNTIGWRLRDARDGREISRGPFLSLLKERLEDEYGPEGIRYLEGSWEEI